MALIKLLEMFFTFALPPKIRCQVLEKTKGNQMLELLLLQALLVLGY
jgi:hypothetical protein